MGERASFAMDRLIAFCNAVPGRTWEADGGANYARVTILTKRRERLGFGYGASLVEAIDRALEQAGA